MIFWMTILVIQLFQKKTNRGCFSSFIDETKTLSFINETLLKYNILIIYY